MSGLQYDEAAAELLEAVYLGPDIVAQRARTLALLGLKRGERVLDIGSGPGFLCNDMAAAVGPTGKVHGIDISPVMVARATARNRHGWVSFATGDGAHLDEADGSCDVAVSIQVAEYVPDIDGFCREAFRVLKPGGRIVVTEFSHPANGIFAAAYTAYLRGVMPVFAKLASTNSDAYTYLADSIAAWPDQKTLASWVRAAGFTNVAYRNLTGGIVAMHRGVKPL